MKNKIFFFVGFLLIILVFTSCNNKKEYKFATTSKGTSYNEVGGLITELINKNDNINFTMLEGSELGSFVNCKKIYRNEVDFAIAQNDTKVSGFLDGEGSVVDSKIRTVIPLYPEILFVVYADTIVANDIKELVTGRRIGVGPFNSGTHRFFEAYLKHCGVDSSAYKFVHTSWAENIVSDKIDISVNVGGYNASAVVEMLNSRKCKIFSLGDYRLYGKGSPVEGFCMNYTTARPFIIPMQTYSYGPKEPVLTLAVDAVLLCNKDVDANDVYTIVDELIKNSKILVDKNPLLSSINSKFDQGTLNFPLHDGTIRYLERDEPSFIEKHIDIIAFLTTILMAGSGVLLAFLRKIKAAKKDRIDEYYEKVLTIEKEMSNINSVAEIKLSLNRLHLIKQDAFKALIEEKLLANESFNIFLGLTDTIITRLEKKLEEL
ncbi:MAG: TAXI family TRAP transporter solute-binding subunit [Bacteroidia bacterium]|nr:TAXI family TRAP transporter solute-binding subunit [Bacteroidia bacterium]